MYSFLSNITSLRKSAFFILKCSGYISNANIRDKKERRNKMNKIYNNLSIEILTKTE